MLLDPEHWVVWRQVVFCGEVGNENAFRRRFQSSLKNPSLNPELNAGRFRWTAVNGYAYDFTGYIAFRVIEEDADPVYADFLSHYAVNFPKAGVQVGGVCDFTPPLKDFLKQPLPPAQSLFHPFLLCDVGVAANAKGNLPRFIVDGKKSAFGQSDLPTFSTESERDARDKALLPKDLPHHLGKLPFRFFISQQVPNRFPNDIAV
jgi:hypothetical protein